MAEIDENVSEMRRILAKVMCLFFCILAAYGSSQDLLWLRSWQPQAAMTAATTQYIL